MRNETTEEKIARLEREGYLDPGCPTCVEYFYPALEKGKTPFAPNHKASEQCKSGKRNHCTCDACF
jgi:hypothetical protein